VDLSLNLRQQVRRKKSMKYVPTRIAGLALFTSIHLCALGDALAGSATWNLSPGTEDWNTAANWTPATVPNGASDIATFGKSNKLSVSLSANTEIDSITFDSGAGAYSLGTGDASTLTLSGSGIVNNSGLKQTIAAEAGPSSYGLVVLKGSASAGNSTTF